MRVLHASYEYPPESTGGLGTYLELLLAHHLRVGDEALLSFHGENRVERADAYLPAFNAHRGLKTYTRRDFPFPDPDVLVLHDWQCLTATQAFWRRGIPVVYTCHLPLAWDVGEFSDVPCDFDAQLEFAGLLRADRVMCVSASVERQLLTAYPHIEGKTVVAHNGVDTDTFAEAVPTREPNVLFVGRYVEQKGFDLLPDIMRQVWAGLPEASLEIMGVGPLEGQVRAEFGSDPRVRWTEFGDLQQVKSAYARAGVVLMPSRFEPFGLVATEAMACARPVVAAAVGGLSDIITDGKDGLLVGSAEAGAYADRLMHLLTNDGLALELGRRARATVVARFRIVDRMQSVSEIYADVVNHSRGSRQ